MKALVLFLSISAVFSSGSLYSADLWFKGANVVDPDTKSIKQLDFGIIKGKIKKGPIPKSVTATNLRGKWIIPGIYDMHVHSTFGNPGPMHSMQILSPEQTAQIVLYAGVTGFLDLFSTEDEIFPARDKSIKATNEARIFAAGPMFTCTGGHGTDLGRPTRVVNNPKEARREIQELAKKKPDVIKISQDSDAGSTMNEATLKATIEAAHKMGLKTIVHIGTWENAKEAILAGTDAITHLWRTDIPDSLVNLMREKKVIEIPTMTYQTEMLYILENRIFLSNPLLSSMIPASLLTAYRTLKTPEPFTAKILAIQSKGRESYPKSLKKIVGANIPILSGTDSGDLGTFHGFSIHREMAILVDAGASPWVALASTTTAAKKFLKQPSGIRDGEVADFVVLSANPIDDITNTQKVERVYHDGVEVDREYARQLAIKDY